MRRDHGVVDDEDGTSLDARPAVRPPESNTDRNVANGHVLLPDHLQAGNGPALQDGSDIPGGTLGQGGTQEEAPPPTPRDSNPAS